MTAQHSTAQTIEDINASMMDDYFDNAMSAKAVAAKYGRAVNTVEALKRAERLKGRTRTKGAISDPRRIENRSPLSGVHIKLGLLITRYKAVHRLNCTQFGLLVNLSRNAVGEAESGSRDLTLTEIMRVCRVLDTDPVSLFHGMHNGPITAVRKTA